MSTNETFLTELNSNCYNIIIELVELNQYVTYEKVIDILWNRYNVNNFNQLFISDPLLLPYLRLVREINSKVNAFIDGYFATRSIITILDLEKELVRYLSSFLIPTLNQHSLQLKDRELSDAADINEVCIDDNCQSSSNNNDQKVNIRKCTSFIEYGFGPLIGHPKLAYYQQQLVALHPNSTEDKFIHSEKVVGILVDCLCDSERRGNYRDTAAITPSYLVKYLADHLGVNNIIEAGILQLGDVGNELMAVRHIAHSRYNFYIEVMKKELNRQQQRFDCDNKYYDAQTSRKRRRRNRNRGHDASISTSNNNDIEDSSINAANASGTECHGNSSDSDSEGSKNSDTHDTSKRDSVPHSREETRHIHSKSYGSNFESHLPTQRQSKSWSIFSSDLMADAATPDITVITNSSLQSLLPWMNINCIDQASDRMKSIGRWGEALTYQYLLQKSNIPVNNSSSGIRYSVEWINEGDETRAGYDIKLQTFSDNSSTLQKLPHYSGETDVQTIYIEVKSSQYADRNLFQLSYWELDFAQKALKQGLCYHIYRVFAAGDSTNVHIVVLKEPIRLIQEGRIKLCLAL